MVPLLLFVRTVEEVVFIVGYLREAVEAWISQHYPDLLAHYVLQEVQDGTADQGVGTGENTLHLYYGWLDLYYGWSSIFSPLTPKRSIVPVADANFVSRSHE